MIDQVCSGLRKALMAVVGLADMSIQKLSKGVDTLSRHGETAWKKCCSKQDCKPSACTQCDADELLSTLSPAQIDALRAALRQDAPQEDAAQPSQMP